MSTMGNHSIRKETKKGALGDLTFKAFPVAAVVTAGILLFTGQEATLSGKDPRVAASVEETKFGNFRASAQVNTDRVQVVEQGEANDFECGEGFVRSEYLHIDNHATTIEEGIKAGEYREMCFTYEMPDEYTLVSGGIDGFNQVFYTDYVETVRDHA